MAVEKFELQGGKKNQKNELQGGNYKKDNPFKLYLISKVQHSFDKKAEEIPEFGNEE
jgi:hypothetical protein